MSKRPGRWKGRIVIHELIAQVSREMRNLSTVGGLRYMLRFPLLRSTVTGAEDEGTLENEHPEEK